MIPRTTSAFNLSIGTSIALESLYDPLGDPYDPDRKVTRVDLNQHDKLIINVHTLIRNLLSAVDKETFVGLQGNAIAESIVEEIAHIEDINNSSPKKLDIQLYSKDYESWKKKQSQYVEFRPLKTKKQIYEQSLLTDTLRLLDDKIELSKTIPEKGRALLLTHHAVDLLDYSKYGSLHLLESHTGKLKDRYSFNSKYAKSNMYNVLDFPWQKKLLFIMGSNDKMIMPFPIKLRRQIAELFTEYKVTPMTTEDRVKLILELHVRDMLFRDIWQSL